MDNKEKKTTDRDYYFFAIKIFGDFGIAIAAPAVIAAWIGTKLDNHYHRYPLFTILCLLLSFLATIKIIQKKSRRYGRIYQKMIDEEKNTKQ